ncbi:hypothetical protein C8J57DRAFT_1240649 [Mycena rebaudengoi]|nr:hypothetical protein C8J57DRAFT_1240649 [Mycena rebaudengoi]
MCRVRGIGDVVGMDIGDGHRSLYLVRMWEPHNGWTVLALPPPAAHAGADLLPPYTPQPTTGIPVAASAPGPTVAFYIPTNTNVIGAVQVTRTKKYGCTVPFNTAFIEICQIMGLEPAAVRIGYKWDNEKVTAPVHRLLTAVDWKDCLESGIGQAKRARTQQNLPEETPAVVQTGKKRKADIYFMREFWELKSHLSCAKHKDQFCYVHSDGNHVRVEPSNLLLWAKEISVGNATKTRPPDNIMFQEYFLPKCHKRARTARAGPSNNLCAPTIHVTVNTGGGSSTVSPPSPVPSAQTPLTPITTATANAANINIPSLFTPVLH